MENEPIRVLHIVPNMQAGGLETLIMNIYRNIDRTKVQFDFLVHYTGNYFYDDEIRSYGKLSYTELIDKYIPYSKKEAIMDKVKRVMVSTGLSKNLKIKKLLTKIKK